LAVASLSDTLVMEFPAAGFEVSMSIVRGDIMSSAPFPSADVMTEVATALDAPIGVEELLQLICLAAVDTVPDAEYASITLADREGNLSTPAATDLLVQRLDALQDVLLEGPCVDAVQGDWESEAVDLRVDRR
jgi:hypothetical protein